jgi:hypothetical protein
VKNLGLLSQLAEVSFISSRRIEDRAYKQCTALMMNDFTLPDYLEYLGIGAFEGCSGLTGTLFAHVTGAWSFAYCTGLKKLDLANCEEIRAGCFTGCTSLTELELPSSLRIIGDDAFYNCTSLTGPLLIPPFVSFIHPNAFRFCFGLINIDLTVKEHFRRLQSWKARGNILMILARFDNEYRRIVEQNGGRLGSDLSNSFLSSISKEAQIIYKAAAHVDGTDNLANGICRLIISFLPMDENDYRPFVSAGDKCDKGPQRSNEDDEWEHDARCAYDEYWQGHDGWWVDPYADYS